jgi:hypothetical protein
MSRVNVDLSFEQLKKALRRLPPTEKITLWRLLDEDIDRPAIARQFAEAVGAIRSAHASISEDEVMADALKATRQVRANRRHAKNRS